LERVLRLVVDPAHEEIHRAWAADDNARGEGLLLLREGHLVVAKQKDPVALLEFGPEGAAALGVSQDTLLGPGDNFALPGEDDERMFLPYTFLHAWPLHGEHLKSINDLAVGPDGALHCLSAASRRIGRIEGRLAPGEHRLHQEETWDRACDLLEGEGGEDRKAEGLVFLPDGTPLVALDTKLSGDNLLVLEPLAQRR
jgi:hypothetical protein